jgi:PAS domain S-box-containing protein
VTADLLDRAPCGFISFTDDGKICYVNSTLRDRLGYDQDSLTGKHVEMLLAPGSRIFYQTHFFPLVKLHGRAQEIFLLLRSSDGESVGMLCNAVRHERNGREITDCVFMEVQERRKFEEALLAAKQTAEAAARQLEEQALELELQHQLLLDQSDELKTLNEDLEKQREAADEANHAKSSFLAVMSHELRTPLNAIGGYVQLLEMGVHGAMTDPQLETLGRIDRSQKHLLRLINDVLNLARIEAGRIDYKIERVKISEVVASVLPMVEPQIARKNLQFTSVVSEDLYASADIEKVQQIVLNVLTNAIKFTASEGKVGVEAGRRSDSQVFVRVVDTGTGIPPSMLEKVFEPFMQVDSSHSRPQEGTGLGLAISRDLARGMGGDLTATSTLGKGSTFELVLSSI